MLLGFQVNDSVFFFMQQCQAALTLTRPVLHNPGSCLCVHLGQSGHKSAREQQLAGTQSFTGRADTKAKLKTRITADDRADPT